jgi:hypothetical protein
MNTPDLSAARWRKSSRSTDTGGDCVEVAGLPDMITVRDSKNPDGPVLTFARHEFRSLLDRLEATPEIR